MAKTATVENEYTTIGTCEHCGDEGVEIFKDNSRCEYCDGKFYPCSICKEEQHEDDHCRHIFQGDDFEWRGSGAWLDPNLKQSAIQAFQPHALAVPRRPANRHPFWPILYMAHSPDDRWWRLAGVKRYHFRARERVREAND